MNGEMQLKAVIAPMTIASVGIFLSLIGIFTVRTKEGATMRDLLHSLGLGTNLSAALIAVATFIILYLLGMENWLGLSMSVITGLAAGVIIGQATEYFTSLQSDKVDCRGITDGVGNCYYKRYRHGNDIDNGSRSNHLYSHHAELPVCQRLRPLHEHGFH